MGKAVHDTDKEVQRQVELAHGPGKSEKASGGTIRADKNSDKKRKDEPDKGSLKLLWKHADLVDKLLMFLGTLGCIVDGSSGTAKIFIVTGIMNSYGGASGIRLQDINKFALIFLYAAIGFGFGASLEGFCWARTAERQASRLRSKYLQAVLRQDVGFFDSNRGSSMTSQVVTSISTDTLVVQGFLSEKVPYFLTNMTMFFSAQVGGLYLCWRLGLIAIPCLLLLIIPGLMVGKLLAASQRRSQQSYAIAGGVVQQALSSIKTVYSYVAEQQTVSKFSTALHPTLEIGIQQGLLKGYAIGSTGVVCAVWSLLAWYGSVLVTEKGIKGSSAFNAATLVINGGLCLGGCLATLKHFIEAKVAAASIFKMIERVPSIDSSDKKGVIIDNVQGGLKFKDIDFAYPSRPDSFVMRKFNLKVNPCETIGLVGGSGSGKSTVINLLERFYDPLKGEVLLDGINIKDLQLKWLRKQMALVNQEPILFATSIKDNILFGKGDASEEEIIQAAKAANAHDFITRLPNGYDTLVGQLGTQMSGGQKQRISIARALLTNPRILLLDEATSALDSHSEKAVQDALNEAAYGRTTLIVAHRFSALRNADSIAVVRSGQVVEFGPPDELLNKKYGAYSTMVQQQRRLMNDENSRTPDITQLKGTPFIGPGASPSRPIASPELSPFRQQRKTEQGQSQEHSTSKFWTLVHMSASQWRSTLLGSIGAVFYGFIQPWQAYCLGALLAVYFSRNDSEIRSETRIYCFAFLGFGICTIVTSVLQHYYFGIVGEHLTKKLREAITEKILSFEIEWFDRDENNTGAISAKLAKDATMVKTLVSDTVSFVIQSLSGIILAMVLSLVLAWKISIVIVAMQPIVIATLYLRVTTMKRMSRKIFKSQNKSSELASEAVSNHRIITAFYSQDKILELFEKAQIVPKKESRKQSWYAAIGLFTSQFVTSANLAVVFWYGGKLIFSKKISFKELFQTFAIMLTTGSVMAQAGSRIADITKGVTALKSIFKILRRHSKMEPDDLDAIIPAKVDGKIELLFVEFFYPTRPKQMILNNFNLMIEAGEVVALVGQSGSGKSTVIKLIERFYDPTKGTVLIDGIDIKHYNLRALRSNIAWVSQEPNLFAGTIYENIAYGTENATEAEVIEAAKLANAHEFISSMPDGYGTHCGERGVQLSGGQKQRIALARAIIKNPPILLLDEATSALDVQSENLVQEALEKTMIGRTCVIVAHRLSTIQRSDRISVVENGTVVEEGSHSQLLAKGGMGAYYALVKVQHEAALK